MLLSEQRTIQEVLDKTACSECLHDKSEHGEGDVITKCYAMDRKGETLFACKCVRFRSDIKLILRVEGENNNEV